MTQFSDLGLAEPLLKALASKGYNTPTPIQTQAIPALLEGRDLCGIAQTGTGKTAAFALPALDRLAREGGLPPKRSARILVLSPTRELAAQIADSTRPIALGQLQPGDLVFFNTMQRRHSHMGVYIGDGRFIHAPSSRGRVRVDRMDNRYFAARVDGARTLVSGPDRLARSDAPACAVTGC